MEEELRLMTDNRNHLIGQRDTARKECLKAQATINELRDQLRHANKLADAQQELLELQKSKRTGKLRGRPLDDDGAIEFADEDRRSGTTQGDIKFCCHDCEQLYMLGITCGLCGHKQRHPSLQEAVQAVLNDIASLKSLDLVNEYTVADWQTRLSDAMNRLPDGRPGTKPIEESPGDLAVRERSPYSFAPPWPHDPRGDFAGNCPKCGGEIFHRLGQPGEFDHKCIEACRGCGQPLLEDNCWMYDGCPCNSPAGVNAGNQIISDWRIHRLNRQVQAIAVLTENANHTAKMLLTAEKERDEARSDAQRRLDSVNDYHEQAQRACIKINELDAACQRLVNENVKLNERNDYLNGQINLLSEIANEGE